MLNAVQFTWFYKVLKSINQFPSILHKIQLILKKLDVFLKVFIICEPAERASSE